MKDDRYLPMKKAYSIANLSNPSNINMNESNWADDLWKYYTNSDKGTKPLNYEVNLGEKTYSVRSLLGAYPSDKEIPVDSIAPKSDHFSEYNYDLLSKLEFDDDDIWNGNVASLRVEDDKVVPITSDYNTVGGFHKILMLEVSQAGNNTLRDNTLSSISDFEEPARPTGVSVGGIIVSENNQGNLSLILGRRSKETARNQSLLSIFPYKQAKYEQLQSGFESAVRYGFCSELFDDSPKGDKFYQRHIDPQRVVSGWNLWDGTLTVGYMLKIKSALSYDIFNNLSQENSEVSEIIEIPISNGEDVVSNINMDNMSASAVSIVYEALTEVDNSDHLQDIPYNIDRRTS